MPPEGKPERARVFFALWPSDAVRAALHRAALDGARRFGGRAMQADTLHLTLAFIGDVALDDLPTLNAAAGKVDCTGFSICLDRLGFWGHNRILWAGCRQGNEGLSTLAEQLAEHLRVAGWATDASAGKNAGRAFAAHVTLVRNVSAKLPELPELPALDWACERFVLVRSRLDAVGASYETLASWPLRS